MSHITSIVLLAYNNLDYTKACIDSIRLHTDSGEYEIIVVDNNSTDGTPEWLKSQTDIVSILNDYNAGFPRGCNIGMKAAKGQDIILLNNDTIVTENWLTNLRTALYSSENIGAVGPVTNSCSNLQTIPCSYSSFDEMFDFAKEHNKSNPTEWEERKRLIGFALLFKREVMDKIGFLDEVFFPGNFEDDDYCLRIRLAGYKLLLCKDTFIHHFGSTSFSKESSERYSKTLSINHVKFSSKWKLNNNEVFAIEDESLNRIKDSFKENNEDIVVSFICVTNDEGLYSKAVSHINKLIVPENVRIEFIKMTNERNIYVAYNKGMKRATGKYKVYFHQDTFITNPNFIKDILFLFNYDKQLGMIGMVGAKKLPPSCVWWESPLNFGEVIESHTGTLAPLKFNEPSIPYEEVEAIDGFLTVTQYDVPWREDIFDCWHFSDISQAQEFRRAGYKVGVPSQIRPWSVHDCGIVGVEGYDDARAIFIKEYK